MKHITQLTVTDCVGLKFSGARLGENLTGVCARFIRSAFMLPSDTALGMQIAFCGDTIPSAAVFSNAALQPRDYAWMFSPCPEIILEEANAPSDLTEMKTYLISGSDLADAEKVFETSSLPEELCALNAVLRIVIPSGSKRAYIVLAAADVLPLRVRVMLSNAFCGAELLEGADKDSNGVSCVVAAENIKGLLSAIREKTDEAEKDTRIEDDEIDSVDEPKPEPSADTSLEELGLSVRAYNCLKRAGIQTLAQLRAMDQDELAAVRNLGRRSFAEVLEKLKEYEYTETSTAQNEKSGKEMLDELIGLEGVKTQVRRITALVRMRQDMLANGRHTESISLNMAFAGNPGTAKTTVARIMAKIFCEAGLLQNAQPIEVGRADLVARYVGQTADNVKAIFQKAKGRLLFIDEAYALLDSHGNSFGDEAINTIVQEMENCRADTVVVFAGYPKPMEEFLSRNPGLRSRIPFRIDFADYSAEEMKQIAVLNAEKQGFSVHPQALEKLTSICAEARRNPESGNGRFCRNMIESAVLSYAERVYGEDSGAEEKDFVLKPCDFRFAPPKAETTVRRIGFCGG